MVDGQTTSEDIYVQKVKKCWREKNKITKIYQMAVVVIGSQRFACILILDDKAPGTIFSLLQDK